MSEEVEAPNLEDPFEAHAYWALAFLCDGCPSGMDIPEGPRQFSRDWFEMIAKQARSDGWTVEDPDGSKCYFDCYCPTCSATSRKKKEPIQPPQTTTGSDAPGRV